MPNFVNSWSMLRPQVVVEFQTSRYCFEVSKSSDKAVAFSYINRTLTLSRVRLILFSLSTTERGNTMHTTATCMSIRPQLTRSTSSKPAVWPANQAARSSLPNRSCPWHPSLPLPHQTAEGMQHEDAHLKRSVPAIAQRPGEPER